MRRVLIVVTALMASLLTAGTFSAQLPMEAARRIQFNTDEATKISADVSPDGRSVVFEILGDLYVVSSSGGAAARLTQGMAMDRYPRWSPDGRRICFVSDGDGTDNVWVINADGSDPRNVTQQDPFERPKSIHRFLLPDWSPDGRHLIVAVTTEKTILYLLNDIFEYAVDKPGEGHSVFDTSVAAEDRAGTEPQYSPDGRFIYYSRMYLNWFSAELNPPWFQIWRYDRQSKRALPVTDRALGAYTPSLSPDGHWMVYAGRNDADSGLRIRNLESGDERWLAFPLDRDRVEYWTIGDLSSYASWAPDSKSVVTSFGGKLQRVDIATARVTPIPFEAQVDVGLGPLNRPPFEVKESDRVVARAPEGVSAAPDESHLAFAAFNRIYVSGAKGGVARPFTDGTLGNEFDPIWSPDGRSIVFAAFDPRSAQGHLYRRSIAGGKATPLTPTPGFFSRPAFTPDGRQIAFIRSEASESLFYQGPALVSLERIPSGGGAASHITDIKLTGDSRAFPASPQFVARFPDRVFFNEFGSGLKSVRLDGSDLRTHLTSFPIGIQGGPVQAAGMITLSGDGSYALVRSAVPAFGAVFIADLRSYDYMSEKPLNLSNELPQTQLTRISPALGGYAPFWSADSKTAYYMAGRRVYHVSADAALQGAKATAAVMLDASLPRARAKGTVLLRGARIITMKGEQVIDRGDILVEGNRIAAVERSGVLQVPQGARVIDMTGLTIMPGMVDAHSHQEQLPYLTAPPPGQYWQNLNRLAYGVTTIVDPFHQVEQFALADLVAAGLSTGPRMFGAGPGFTENEFLFSMADAREIVSRQSQLFDERIVKNYNVGGRITRQWLVSAAQEAGRIAVYETDGNLHKSMSAIFDGYSHMAHGFALPLYKDMSTLLAQSGTGVCYQFGTLRGEGGPSSIYYFYDESLKAELAGRLPFTMPYQHIVARTRRRVHIDHDDHIFRYYSGELEKLMAVGVPVAVGDHETFFGLGMVWETMSLASAMKSNLPALKAATINGALLNGLDHDLGTLEPGKLADLIALDGNPLTDIKALANTRYTMANGVLYDSRTLDEIWPRQRPLSPRPWWWNQAPEVRPGAVRSGGSPEPQKFDVIIKNGVVYDGTGKPGVPEDVAISGDRVVSVGNLGNATARSVIDAQGLAVAPGFINTLSWATDTLIVDGLSQSDIRQGVTLEVFGEGWSMGPLNDPMKAFLVDTLQTDLKYPVTWTTLAEYLDYLEHKGVSPNVASFVGATTVRIHELGFEDRAPNAPELVRMQELVRQAMREGALGVGASLIYAPSFYAKTDELVALTSAAAEFGGGYITHMRSEGDRLLEGIDETVEIARRAKTWAQIYHFKQAGKENWGKRDAAIARLDAARREGLDVSADMYLYSAGATGLNASMPPWVQEGGFEAWIARLKDLAIRKRVIEEMRHPGVGWENLYYTAGGAQNVLLIGFKSEALKPLTGKTVAEVARLRGTSPEDVILDLVIEDRSPVESMYSLMSEDNIAKNVQWPYMMFGSDAGSPAPTGVFLKSNVHPRTYGNFARLLGKYVREDKVITLEEAIRRLTGLTAAQLRLKDRGCLAPACYADVVVFDPMTIGDKATYEAPHQYSVGVKHVLVNGVPVLKDGAHTGATPGRVVRGPGWAGTR